MPEDFFQSPEIIAVAKEGMIDRLRDGDLMEALLIKDTLKSLPKDILGSSEILDAASWGVASSLRRGDVDRAIKIKEIFDLPEEVLSASAK